MYAEYTTIHWLFFFYFYCFFGWCFESTYVSLKNRRWVNRGFMRGPFLPLYGSGAIMMLLVSMPFQEHLVMVYVAGCIGATLLEYVTGVAMEAIFKVRYWDYSNQRFQFQGHICLSSSLAWGGLTILMTEWMHKPVEHFVMMIPSELLTVLVVVITAVVCADFALSFKAALDLRDVLLKLEKAKEELAHIQKRLDVVIALTNEELSERREAIVGEITQRRDVLAEHLEQRVEDMKEGIDEKLQKIRCLAQNGSNKYLENTREELFELRMKYKNILEERERLSGLKDAFQRSLLRAHPGMTSVRFKEALEELKRYSLEKKQDNKKEHK